MAVVGAEIVRRGALAGPESAAEHVRNALQLLMAPWSYRHEDDQGTAFWYGSEIEEELFEVRDRLRRAIAMLEQPPRGAADATGTP